MQPCVTSSIIPSHNPSLPPSSPPIKKKCFDLQFELAQIKMRFGISKWSIAKLKNFHFYSLSNPKHEKKIGSKPLTIFEFLSKNLKNVEISFECKIFIC